MVNRAIVSHRRFAVFRVFNAFRTLNVRTEVTPPTVCFVTYRKATKRLKVDVIVTRQGEVFVVLFELLGMSICSIGFQYLQRNRCAILRHCHHIVVHPAACSAMRAKAIVIDATR